MIIISLITFFFIIDRFLKFIALNIDFQKDLLGNFFKFNFVKNYYIAFSIPISGIILSIIIGVILIFILMLLINYYKKGDLNLFFPLFMIFCGASSNFFDRIKYGFVIDYLDLDYFTVFNIADSMIVVGAMFLVLFSKREIKG